MTNVTIQSTLRSAQKCAEVLHDKKLSIFFDQEFSDTWVLKQCLLTEQEQENFIEEVKAELIDAGVELNENIL